MRIQVHEIHDGDRRRRQFIADCRWIAIALGRPGLGQIDGALRERCLVYRDEMILIEASPTSGGMTVTRLPQPTPEHLQASNPVVYTHAAGDIYRYHGEASYLFDHVRQLVIKGLA